MKYNFHFKPLREDVFLITLQQRVNTYFIDRGIHKKANNAMWIKAVVMMAGMFSLYFILLFGGLGKLSMLVCATMLGIFIAGVGCNVSHDALHYTFSNKKWINRCLGYSMDFIGSNSYLWKINHNAHHYYTNISGLDGDIRENVLIRFSPHTPYKKTYYIQLFTTFIIYGSFLLLIIYSFNINNMFKKNLGAKASIEHPGHEIVKLVLWKLWYLAFWVLIPYHFIEVSFLEFVTGYLAMNFAAGYLLAFNFMAPHNFEETTYILPVTDKKRSWAEHQLRTTCNFKTSNKILSYFIGALNHQIEHHLFPEICSIHYPEISKIVKKVSLDFNIPYHEKESFFDILFSHLRVLKKHSRRIPEIQ
ncbi:acyl-CoA desaturase [Fulvivirgaceae bacterium BMA10]|uniref:Acyl-CoA desaturase n=1 Tax=Splendidivirga corallicola TaxID=3051826 RepID=A0ABT8KP35_9BACT|nr:acyl-CoA desaturase [Fulvivirgaceae bacterium BMA10]